MSCGVLSNSLSVCTLTVTKPFERLPLFSKCITLRGIWPSTTWIIFHGCLRHPYHSIYRFVLGGWGGGILIWPSRTGWIGVKYQEQINQLFLENPEVTLCGERKDIKIKALTSREMAVRSRSLLFYIMIIQKSSHLTQSSIKDWQLHSDEMNSTV